MKIPFTKMQGAGNDFVVVENLDGALSLSPEQIRQLCDRRFGIGADGLIFFEKSPEHDLGARMIYYNADGSRGEMCGNGARCFTAFAFDHGFGENGRLRFLTDAGPLAATTKKKGLYTIEMPPPGDLELKTKLELAAGSLTVHFVNTGVPHVVHFADEIASIDLATLGSEIRHHDAFSPQGVNVNLVRIDANQSINIRTYERGVENETLACGTGVTATALIAHLLYGTEKPVQIRVAGGDLLEVDFDKTGEAFTNVTLAGPAKTVFAGEIEI